MTELSPGQQQAEGGAGGNPEACVAGRSKKNLDHQQKQAEVGAGGSPEACVTGQSKNTLGDQRILEGILKDLRERKATKADNADVATYLWEKHLVSDGTNIWEPSELPGLRKASEVVRRGMLRWWKIQMRRNFIIWLRQKHCHLNGVYDSGKGGIIWTGNRYKWRTAGLETYILWVNERWLVCPSDLEAGSDVVTRATNSSWWLWEDGSRPFHWKWPEEYQNTIQDGLKIHFRKRSPEYKKPQ